MAKGLGRLAGREQDGRESDVRRVEPGHQPRKMVRGDIFVRDDRHMAAPEHRQQITPRALHQARPGDDVVAAFPEAYLDFPHPGHSPASAPLPAR